MDDARKRVTNRLSAQGITVREINLYDLSIDLLKDRGVWEQVLAVEPELGKDEFREPLQGMLDPQDYLAPAVGERIADSGFDILFLTGIGEVFPYIRSHNVLNNLQSVVVGKPMLMFFPGKYAQSETLGSSLVLFGLLQDDQYYRAKDIQEQESWPERCFWAPSSPRTCSAPSRASSKPMTPRTSLPRSRSTS
ncbi:DUF1788 domain-containing protein [Streptomyces sp. GLT-R25]